MSDNREAILDYLNRGREDRERTAIEAGERFQRVRQLRAELDRVEQDFEKSVDAALDAGWQHSELIELGISEDPRTIAARKAARKKQDSPKAY